MLQLLLKALISGVLIAAASEVAKRMPVFGALIASLPLVAVLAMIWLWRDTASPERISSFSAATFWYVLPSLPMFLAIPAMLRHGLPFWISLGFGCLLTIILYALLSWLAQHIGLPH